MTDSVTHRRILARLVGQSAGPTLVAVTGIHGNEPAGLAAAERIVAWLERERPELSGELVFLAGNLQALERKQRFIDVDLNRQWTPAKLAELAAGTAADGAPVERFEQRALLAALREAAERARGPLHFIDLHTSSATGPPFLTVGDTLRNRRFARSIPLPLILGLEEQVDGALLELLNNYGFVTLGVEAGRHDDPRSIDCHEAVLWLALVATGLLSAAHAPELEPYRARLREASRNVPPVIEVWHRHPIADTDRFRMREGFVNFMPIRRGELLADDRRGSVRAPADGLILFPLYQGQGEDGFFLARAVHPFWLSVSALLRKLRGDVLVRYLPGVRTDPTDSAVLIVDTRVARLVPLEIFHLLGFRKVRQVGASLVVSRRRYDLEPPARITIG